MVLKNITKKLKLNSEETQNMQISANIQIMSNCETKNVKLVGFTLDNKLNWSAHINHLEKKFVGSYYNQLKKIFLVFILRQLKKLSSLYIPLKLCIYLSFTRMSVMVYIILTILFSICPNFLDA